MKTNRLLTSVVTVTLSFFLFAMPQNGYAESKKLKKAHRTVAQLEKENDNCRDTSSARLATIKGLREQIAVLKSQVSDQKAHVKDLSDISGSQAESLKKSFESIEARDAYIRSLWAEMARKDSQTNGLMNNLKNAIGSLDKKDITIKIENDVIYIDISDNMLFKSGKYQVTDQAKEVLGKVATVLLAHPDINFMVEGNTDNVPYHEGVLTDNWDLSAKRATSVIRILQNQYNMPPQRMTAAGKGEYLPVASNGTAEGKALNRRTRIAILPQLDKFFQLLDKK